MATEKRSHNPGRPPPRPRGPSIDPASRWVAEATGGAERLQHPAGGLGLCGDARPSRAQAESVAAGRAQTQELRHYAELLSARVSILRGAAAVAASDLPRLETQARVLGLWLGGAELVEISAALGRRSHSYASGVLARVRSEAAALRSAWGPVIAPPCKCGCGHLAVSLAGGRPRKYATERCRAAHTGRLTRRARWLRSARIVLGDESPRRLEG